MSVADYLIDTSALARVLLRQATETWEQRMAAGLIALCDLTELEVLYSARSAKDREAVQARLDQFTWCPMPDGIYRRARVVQRELTTKGEQRSAGAVDLLVAAAAEEAGLVLLHHDPDFETIARTTGQPVRMIDLK
ncbi:PIN domain nuclease [Streptomyces griseorubiginosus]|uniref:PIN domain nuclease n=1 Tax=Streptomyces griseorubiginosus TaxID=67304 RepID=UPI002E814952|nr:PIN domain nuclease [Streptomyces griseorubiginosus]WUB46153.1 PIN domain nuclease [Streptomyces griseorubiginosus]WUB54674.1 PIN domain nuclease [Streptomyces griseorubiginosus]